MDIPRQQLEQTASLAEAVELLFGRQISGRTHILHEEAMEGQLARHYHQLGLQHRQETYREIVLDVKERSGELSGTIIDAACGSGLLTKHLLAETSAQIIAFDTSAAMIEFARQYLYYGQEDTGRLRFVKESVYRLPEIQGFPINHIICRNALHRFHNPERAIAAMYKTVTAGGTLYLTDIKRDAPWEILLERIGEERWQHPALVMDYVGALAGALTVAELDETLEKLQIKNYEISNGVPRKKQQHKGLNEYSDVVSYVAIVRK